MLDEEMDHIIREAANNHHPAYNDRAWEKMELQLNKHLPQKNDRRRLIFFLLFFLLLGAGVLYTLNRFGNNKNIVAQKDSFAKKIQTVNEPGQGAASTDEESNRQQPGVLADNNKTETTGSNLTLQPEDKKGKDNFADVVDIKSDGFTINTTQKTGNKLQKTGTKNNFAFADALKNSNDEPALSRKQKTGNGFKTKTWISAASPFEEIQTVEESVDNRKPVKLKINEKLKVTIVSPASENDEGVSKADVLIRNKNEEVANEEIKMKKEAVKDSVKQVAEDKKLTATKKPSSSSYKKKTENKFKNNFGLTFSVGPDMSFVKLNNTGKTTLTYGAGISYDFAKRFTARAGFYVSKKIYQAAPDQYHTPGGNYPYLTDVEANCRVYEIPVSLSYNFGRHNKHNWFGSAGLSSFIMKKEDYTYNYKNPAGQTYAYYQEVKNQNKHYFAVLNLSAGYQYQFSKRLSLQAEPYLQIPLSGVGQGKIKLNSAGILFTLTLKPFVKNK
jgi:hypothetical protein